MTAPSGGFAPLNCDLLCEDLLAVSSEQRGPGVTDMEALNLTHRKNSVNFCNEQESQTTVSSKECRHPVGHLSDGKEKG